MLPFFKSAISIAQQDRTSPIGPIENKLHNYKLYFRGNTWLAVLLNKIQVIGLII